MRLVNNNCFTAVAAALLLAFCGPRAFGGGKALSRSAWKPILKVLNQPRDATPGSAALHTHAIEADLHRVYNEELTAVLRSWEKERQKSLSGNVPTSALRENKNRFFHEKILALNQITIETLENSARRPGALGTDHREVAGRILRQIAENQVASVQGVGGFDRTGEIGFCFGRALLVHYLLLKAGVSPNDIEKIFVVGELMIQNQLWRFHTAILVRDAEAGFLAIDPLQPRPVPYKEWIAINASREIKGRFSRARFYVTDPRKFLPSYGAYHLNQIEDPILRDYFAALLGTMTERHHREK